MSSAPVFPYPGGVAGDEPPDPKPGTPGHFAWSNWIKQFVKNLDRDKVSKSGDTMTGMLNIERPEGGTVFRLSQNNAAYQLIPADSGLSVTNKDNTNYANMYVAGPDQLLHAANKQYVDTRSQQVWCGNLTWVNKNAVGQYFYNLNTVIPASSVIHGVHVAVWGINAGFSFAVISGNPADFGFHVAGAGTPFSEPTVVLNTMIVYTTP